MEKDIKLLEDLFYKDESYEPNGYVEIFLHKEQQQAIKNLIKRNKELEIENKTLRAHKNGCPAIQTTGIECQLKNELKELEEENKVPKFGEWIGKNYIDYKFEYENYQRILADCIPKSKIKQKIEELKYQTLYIDGITDKKETEIASVGSLMGKIQVLQELLDK